MGLGLARLLMLRKGIDDIRLLRSEDPRVRAQMLDLSPYKAVSREPATRRDLSLVVAAERTEAELGDRVRTALGTDADCVESIGWRVCVNRRGRTHASAFRSRDARSPGPNCT